MARLTGPPVAAEGLVLEEPLAFEHLAGRGLVLVSLAATAITIAHVSAAPRIARFMSPLFRSAGAAWSVVGRVRSTRQAPAVCGLSLRIVAT
jgi:hypothetical protein